MVGAAGPERTFSRKLILTACGPVNVEVLSAVLDQLIAWQCWLVIGSDVCHVTGSLQRSVPRQCSAVDHHQLGERVRVLGAGFVRHHVRRRQGQSSSHQVQTNTSSITTTSHFPLLFWKRISGMSGTDAINTDPNHRDNPLASSSLYLSSPYFLLFTLCRFHYFVVPSRCYV